MNKGSPGNLYLCKQDSQVLEARWNPTIVQKLRKSYKIGKLKESKSLVPNENLKE